MADTYLKPQVPQYDTEQEQYFYPLSTVDQIIMPDNSRLNTKISTMETIVSSVNTKVTNLEPRVTTAETNIANTNNTVSTLSTTVGTINTSVNNLGAKVTGLDSRVTALDTKVTNGIVNTYTCKTTGTIHALTGTGQNIVFQADANFVAGNTFTVNTVAVTATQTNGAALPANFFISGAMVNCTYQQSTKKLFFKSGGTQTADATATAADILSGKTAYGANGKITGTIQSKVSTTYTPGPSNQIIPAGQYLYGAQTILGDQNLTPYNIRFGSSIFGIQGQLPEAYYVLTYSWNGTSTWIYPQPDMVTDTSFTSIFPLEDHPGQPYITVKENCTLQCNLFHRTYNGMQLNNLYVSVQNDMGQDYYVYEEPSGGSGVGAAMLGTHKFFKNDSFSIGLRGETADLQISISLVFSQVSA